jgi:hypothetical protein
LSKGWSFAIWLALLGTAVGGLIVVGAALPRRAYITRAQLRPFVDRRADIGIAGGMLFGTAAVLLLLLVRG